ncbi:ligand-binding sensor domain-containing protein [Pleionea litopenaei]|uniref:Two-component regulator propeller domain-containing protein n=1 Tax=Pleionea litopenaei TaxID=3070815 RepID=A0AA51RRW2_9GAMM|nr:two-component regulator propeller domain-containing protein [Pleionea sp. HL-JVS1]WMS86398.1 two-component regulator propeller domain-containing protein [Pleionea sp. HL-JVS1]
MRNTKAARHQALRLKQYVLLARRSILRWSSWWLSVFLLPPLFSAELENTRFQHISTHQGLSQKTVQSIYQDRTGFMWFGTQEGLNRFDGHTMRVYRHNSSDPDSLSHDAIRDVYEDQQGRLFVATSGGLNVFNAADEKFITLNIQVGGEPVLRFNTLYRDRSGMLWVGTDGHGLLQLVQTPSGYSAQSISDHVQLKTADVRVVFEDSRGRLWIGTDGQGVFRMHQQSLVHFSAESPESQLSHNRIRDIIEDSKGRIWVGTRGGGLNRYDELNKSFIAFRHDETSNSLTHDRVYQIIEDDFSRLWIATDGGISVLDLNSERFVSIKHKSSQKSALTHNRVLSAYKDQGGLLWFGTLSGLNRWNPKYATFVHYRNISEDQYSLNNNTVYSLAQLDHERLAIGTFGGGVNILNLTDDLIRPLKTEQSKATRIMSMLVDSQQQLWVGSIASGVEVYDSLGNFTIGYQNNPEQPTSLSADGVTDIMEDSNGNIWIATYRAGLNRLMNNSAFKRFNMSENTSGLLSESIFAMTEDDDGYIWLATDGGGLSRLDKTSGEIISIVHDAELDNSLSGNIASSIYFDSRGRLWIGTHGNGLNLWLPENRRKLKNVFTHFSINSGLNSSTINGIIEDKNGDIWVSTVKGVSRLDFSSMQFVNFNLADEIHFNELNQGALLASESGSLFFGGLNGVSAFDPDKLSKNTHVPKVVLTGIYDEHQSLTFDTPVEQLKQLQLTHQDYLIAFEFAALDYSNPEKNTYQYKLEGFDENWISAGQRSRATFTNLPTGEYTFKVKGSNDDGLWSDDSIHLKVIVLPAPWVSWWAFSLYALIFCMFLIWFIRVQAKRLASNDVFQDQVDLAVNDKTEIIRNHSQILEERFQKLADISMIDIDDGRPNHKYFIEQLDLILKLTQDNSAFRVQRQQLTLFMLTSASDNLSELEFQFHQNLSFVDPIIKLSKWSNNQLVCCFFIEDVKDVLPRLKELSKQTSFPVSSAMLRPYTTLANAIEQSDLLMLLLEYLASFGHEHQQSYVAVTDVLQLIDSNTLREIVKRTDLAQQQIFKVYLSE